MNPQALNILLLGLVVNPSEDIYYTILDLASKGRENVTLGLPVKTLDMTTQRASG